MIYALVALNFAWAAIVGVAIVLARQPLEALVARLRDDAEWHRETHGVLTRLAAGQEDHTKALREMIARM